MTQAKPRGNAADRARREKISASLARYWDAKGRGPGLARMMAEAKPGECAFCGDAVKPKRTKPSKVCGGPECMTAYRRCWRRDQREALRAVSASMKRLEALMEAP